MKQLTPIQVKAEITRRNKLFKGASKAEKRVLIAKDVIKQIEKSKIKVLTGNFVTFDYRIENKDEECSLQTALLENSIPCTCCALGAMMVATTLFANKEKVSDIKNDFNDLGDAIQDVKLRNGFNTLFSMEQLREIETAFELGFGWFSGYHENRKEAIDFGRKYKTSRTRLIAIMENIIANKGTFIP